MIVASYTPNTGRDTRVQVMELQLRQQCSVYLVNTFSYFTTVAETSMVRASLI